AGHVAPAVLAGPRHANPTALGQLLHERAPGRRVDQLGHALAGGVHDVGVVVLLEEVPNFLLKGLLFVGVFEVHGMPPDQRKWRLSEYLTVRQTSTRGR